MLNYMITYYYPRKSSLDPTICSIYLRVTVNQERLVFGAVTAVCGLGLPKSVMIETAHWDDRKGRVKAGTPHARIINDAITECDRKLDKLYAQHEGYDLLMTAGRLKELFLNGGRLRPTLSDLMGQFIEERKATNTRQSTLETYQFKFRTILAFLTAKNYLAKAAEDFSPGMLKEYRLFMIQERGNSERSADKSCQVVKTILLWAAGNERIKINPLINIRVRVDQTPNLECLTQDELEILRTAQLIPEMRVVADCFRFACYTGLAYQDMKAVSEDSKQLVEDKWCLVGKRLKTSTEFVIPITKPVWELIETYNGLKMPLPKPDDYNLILRQIMLVMGIKKRITSHTARKTFADWCINELGLTEEATIVAMGQKDPKELEPYRRIRPKRLLSEFPEDLLDQ